MLVAHNFYGFDLDVLLHRMQELKIFNWDRLGRLKKGNKYVHCLCNFFYRL